MPGFNIWDMLGLQQDNQNPAVMSQMSQQAAPSGVPPMLARLPQQQPPLPPPPPQITPVADQEYQPTAQPTTTPIGLPSMVMQPSQPALTSPNDQAMAQLRAYYMSQKPTYSPEMEAQVKAADVNSANILSGQGKEIDEQKGYLKKYQDLEQPTDFRPLAGLVDSLTGSKLSQAAESMAPESKAKQILNQNDLQKAITQASQSLTKDQLDYLKQKLAQQGYVENRASKEQIAKNMDLAKLATGGQSQGLAQARLDVQKQRLGMQEDRLRASAGDLIDKDELIKGANKQSQQIALDRHTLATAPIVTPQIWSEVQLGLGNAISGGRSAAVSTQNKVEFQSLENDYTALKQRIENHPEDIGSPEVKKMMIDTFDRLQEAYQNNAYARAQQLANGRDKAYRNVPSAMDVINQKVDSYKPAAKASAANPSGTMGIDEFLKARGK